ncbi:hypothetical protein BGZ99_006665 [Dissophora globulifera]|uniref:Uncharacterized protein n=1 Tax=Dissophora globulifera TaxID=979702 RepID=A0A9P6US23_9FUNG|nr:hypothetical protein BGZ99_006665 [Dissophora globulifera]
MLDTLEELDLSLCPLLPTSITQVIMLTCRKLKRFKARNFHASVLDRRPHDLENISNAAYDPSRIGYRLSNNYTSSHVYDNDDDDDARYSDEDEDEERELTWHLLTSLNSPGQSQVSPPPFDSVRNWTWACTSLEELELHVKSPGGHSDTNVTAFLTQLSELTNLQKLILGWSSDIRQLPSDWPNEFASAEARLDLTLRGSGGGLAKLHTLTRLKYFDVQSIDLLDMDTDDFRWMGTHWTSLRTVRTSWVNDEDKSKEIKIRHLLLNEFPHIALYRPEPSH